LLGAVGLAVDVVADVANELGDLLAGEAGGFFDAVSSASRASAVS
jgi:hypothetical protein